MTTNRHDVHEIAIDAPAEAVYERLSDVGRWATLFPPTIHAEVIERAGSEERIQMWATAQGEAHSWVSRRVLDPFALRIEFRQERSSHPVGRMQGEWVVKSPAATRSVVTLSHEYEAADGTEEQLDWIGAAVDRNSLAELGALKEVLELEARSGGGAPFTFEDSVTTSGDPARVFEFLDRGDQWAEQLDHVADAQMSESGHGLQRLRMVTRAPDGSTHTTESYRVSLPPDRIVYKQTTLPALLRLHTGVWVVRPEQGRWRITSQHTVAVAEDRVREVLGPGAAVEDARALARTNLGNNSRLTLTAAVAYAEGE